MYINVNNIDKAFKKVISKLLEHKLIPPTPKIFDIVMDANTEIIHKEENMFKDVFKGKIYPVKLAGIIDANRGCRLSMSKFVHFQWSWNSDKSKIILEMYFYGNLYGKLEELKRTEAYLNGSPEYPSFLVESGDWRIDKISIYNFNNKGSHIEICSYNDSIVSFFDKLGV
ncbi:MAG: hypothetical protein M1334_04080 [Patescibacteria group bacterium]|nr:hypothetical protein [Patescibacteria group bacterium]